MNLILAKKKKNCFLKNPLFILRIPSRTHRATHFKDIIRSKRWVDID